MEGSLGREKVRRSLDLTNWEAASDLIAKWNASGEIGVKKTEIPTIREAVAKFVEYAETSKLNWETRRKYSALLERRFLPWCEAQGFRQFKQINVDALRTFQNSWDDGANYAQKNIERLRSFFKFCLESDWVKSNPAKGMKRPTVKQSPTLPFSPDEMKRILAAADAYPGDAVRMKAFILTMRHSGLRIGDTITLSKKRLSEDKLQLYTQKTGTPVFVPLPPIVVKALGKVKSEGDHFFWSGNNTRSAVANWSKYLARVFEIAKVENAHSHRFRDTAAVNWLLAGIPLEDVSILLGHSSIKVTERAYSPWIKARQTRLETLVKQSWKTKA